MKIIVDAMGGDHAPQEIVKGALQARRAYGYDIVLVGRQEEVLQALHEAGEQDVPQGVEIRHASEVVEICDEPSTAFKTKKDSSLTVGLTMLRDGEGDGFVSAGSTGALLAGATLVVKRIRGVRRAALAPVIPTAEGRAVLCDCGANAECSVEYLTQFALLGSFYAKKALGLESPRVGLLNIGAEPSKGDALRRETYEKLLALGESGAIRFIGNVEPKEAMYGGADVIVADGFAGNVMLKSIEGVGGFMGRKLKGMFKKNALTMLAGLLVKKELTAFKEVLDPNKIGGTAILGIAKPVIKAHGSSNAEAICNAIRQAAETAEADVAGEMAKNIQLLHAQNED
ncbi:MAG: phosphate acyltransferase PlsX [Oscillospiraceae bacterium]